ARVTDRSPRRTPASAWVVAVATLLAGCAPHRIEAPALDSEQLRARFERALAARERHGSAVEADLAGWVRWKRGLPGGQARLLRAAPDRFRLRVESLLGTALDVAGRGDSLVAWVPAKHAGAALDARRDTLGVAAPGALAFRAWSAAWRPPGRAWADARWDDSL